MKKYSILPHYSKVGDKIMFLKKIEVPLSLEDRILLNKICSKNSDYNTSDLRIISKLIDQGIIIDVEEKIRQNYNPVEIVVAAHSDDTALSIGGYILANTNSYFHIINVFSSCPESSTLSRYLKTSEEVTLFNNMEEQFYAWVIGAQLKFLNYPEALERGYTDIFTTKISKEDIKLTEKLIDKIAGYSIKQRAMTIYFPLSIGNHIDHFILYKIGRKMLAEGVNVLFYEDLPYAKEIGPRELESQLEEKTRGLEVVKKVEVSEVLQRKLLLANMYKTQYDKRYLSKIANYSFEIGKGRTIERLWGFQNEKE